MSVVIPTHQAAELVGRAVRSVLDQTYQDFEIVVIDNGSTDDTADVIAAFGDDRIRYRWQPDSGLPADSRNAGVGMAVGEYVAFLDADDLWYPGKLAAVTAAFDEDPALALVCHDVAVTRAGERVGERAYAPDTSHMYEELLYVGNFLTTSAVTVRREAVLAAGGFDIKPAFLTVEDYDLWLRLAEAGGRFLFLHVVLGEYVLYPGSMSAKLERHYDNLLNVVEAHFAREAARGRLDARRALRRSVRSRLGLVRDLAKSGAWGRAFARALRVPGFALHARRVYRALAATPRSA